MFPRDNVSSDLFKHAGNKMLERDRILLSDFIFVGNQIVGSDNVSFIRSFYICRESSVSFIRSVYTCREPKQIQELG